MSQKSTAYWPTPNTLDGMRGRTQEELSKVKNKGNWAGRKHMNTGNLRDAVMDTELVTTAWSQLSLLPGDSHVRMSAPQGKGRESRKVHAVDYGQSFTESFANYDPDTSSWRTSQGCLLTGWAEFSETWPTSGTMRNGRCYRRQMSAHRTSEKGSSSWPTPTARDWKQPGKNGRWRDGKLQLDTLDRAVQQWPTPSVRDHKGGYIGGRIRDGKISRDTLDVAVQHTDNKEKTGGQLNPTWVEWLMGFPSGWTDLRA